MSENSRTFKRRQGTEPFVIPATARFLIVIAMSMMAISARPARTQPVGLSMSVDAVPDGDTIRIGRRRVSLLGITAPRPGDSYATEPLAREARDRLSSLVMLRYVRLEYDGQRGRAYVFTEDGVFVNAELVRAGLARVAGRPGLKRLTVLRAAEAEARAARRGIWRVTTRVQ